MNPAEAFAVGVAVMVIGAAVLVAVAWHFREKGGKNKRA